MAVSRRDFLKFSAAGTGTALAGLVGAGVDLAPAVARAQELRIKEAKTTPSVCPYCSVGQDVPHAFALAFDLEKNQMLMPRQFDAPERPVFAAGRERGQIRQIAETHNALRDKNLLQCNLEPGARDFRKSSRRRF